ncbi:hypothetical protein [Spiroplasma platyhelix]|uniref:Uncharacterized protein n=1 Tax=Spiroplasma platyhelix PALS-1 TaxID=1276218 RepID=A0A846U265_9MOLU|nr:hypothetical protein [Spiroplasma platyhelix]MBE4704236.1 hypothetical protein [Spiroplasma platyhelix PALS-1]NKE38609.1 hypothetical protein [Spiroplasma platyhelix PALS-1]UJB28820.1 hypothetical protein SPLAT_v1c00530 [Spiroplasma platyhelix PALS-1]
MKNLLSALAIASLSTTIAAPLINQSISSNNNLQLNQAYQTKELYWYEGQTELEIEVSWAIDTTEVFSYIMDLGQDSISNYRTFSALDLNYQSYTKTSWGSDNYFGDTFKSIQNRSISSGFVNRRVETTADIINNSKIEMLNVHAVHGMAKMESVQKIGFSYYSDQNGNHMQLFGYQYAESWISMSGGYMSINIGQGIRLES